MWNKLRSLTSASLGSVSPSQAPSQAPASTIPDVATVEQRPTLQSVGDVEDLHTVSPYVYATLSAIVYNEKGPIPIPAGWRALMSCASCGLHREGFYAVAYIHEATRHCIIAARGTSDVFGLRAAVWLYFDEMTIQLCLAEQFSKLVRERLAAWPSSSSESALPSEVPSSPMWKNDSSDAPEHEEWFVSYTGHSLGAVIATWRAVEERTFAVTFESPGCHQLLEKIQDNRLRDGEAMASTINYVRLPNPINTLKSQCGYVIMLPIPALVMPSGTLMLAANDDTAQAISSRTSQLNHSTPAVVHPVVAAAAAARDTAAQAPGTGTGEVAVVVAPASETSKPAVATDDGVASESAGQSGSPTTAMSGKASMKPSSRLSTFLRLPRVTRGAAAQSATSAVAVSPVNPASPASSSIPRWRSLGPSMPVFRVPSIRSYAAAYTRDRMLTSVGIPELQQYLTKVEPVIREMMEHTQQVHSIHNFVNYFAREEAASSTRQTVMTNETRRRGWSDKVVEEEGGGGGRGRKETIDPLSGVSPSENAAATAARTRRAAPTQVHESEEVVLQWPNSVLQFVEYYNTSRALDDPMNRATRAHAAYEALLCRLCNTEPRPLYRIPIRFIHPEARVLLDLWWRWPAERRQSMRLSMLDHKALNCMTVVQDELWTDTLTALQAKQYLTRLLRRRSIQEILRREEAKAEQHQENTKHMAKLVNSKL